jgi:hypothetical protein
MPDTEIIKFAQAQLNKKGFNCGTPDGVVGNKTIQALDKVTSLPKTWSIERKIIGFIQTVAKENGFDPNGIDGFWGANTQLAYERLVHKELFGVEPAIWRPEENIPVNPNHWPQEDVQSLINFYGQKATNLVSLTLPYSMKLSWDKSKTVTKITCNKKVKDSIEKVLVEVKSHYGLEAIKTLKLDLFGGCFNDRPIRNGTRPSTHAWGIALDFDPENNQLKWGRDKATFAKPDYDAWWQIWESEGWVSLGRARNFDWMHVQAAKLNS